jgi:hypothetical protein
MKCMHCLVEFHDTVKYIPLDSDHDRMWIIEQYHCPACDKLNIFLVNCDGESIEHLPINVKTRLPVHPRGPGRVPCPVQVPEKIAAEYREACMVFYESPRASAAISRGVLQRILRETAKVSKGNLINEILEVVGGEHLPDHLALLLSAILKVGNFAAFPLKGSHPTCIMPAETAEAALNLDVLEGLFDFYYVQPAMNARRFKSLNNMLKAGSR